MSSTLDLLNAQNLTRAQAVVGAAALANRSFTGANVSGSAGRAALAGTALTSLGNILSGFQTRRRTGDGFNVSEFSSRVSRLGGLAQTSNFLVSIEPPKFLDFALADGSLTPELRNMARNLIFLCSAAAIPGVQIQTTDIQHYGYGAIDRRPISASFPIINLNFYVDVDSTVYKFFTNWANGITNYNDDAVANRTSYKAFFNEVHYKNDFATTITIYVYDAAGNNFLEVKLKEAFPIEIGQVNLTWGNYNSIAILPVRISYTNWTSNYTPPAKISADGLRNLTLSSALLRAGTLVSFGSSLIRRPQNVADVFNLVNNASILRNVLYR